MGDYDSRPDTWQHIHTVRGLLGETITEMMRRAQQHDQSKLADPERATFDEYTPKLKASTYGSGEYKGFLAGMRVALDHHYAVNSHHPEHFEDGYAGMSLLDVLEMLADWKAATLRHDDGDLDRSISINAERFGYGEEFERLLRTTARDMGWL